MMPRMTGAAVAAAALGTAALAMAAGPQPRFEYRRVLASPRADTTSHSVVRVERAPQRQAPYPLTDHEAEGVERQRPGAWRRHALPDVLFVHGNRLR